MNAHLSPLVQREFGGGNHGTYESCFSRPLNELCSNFIYIFSVRKNRLKSQLGEPSKGRSASACRSTDKGSVAAAAMARLELEDCETSNSGSLEDLVNSFDEKLTAVLQNYQEKVDKIAPVQVRTTWVRTLGVENYVHVRSPAKMFSCMIFHHTQKGYHATCQE